MAKTKKECEKYKLARQKQKRECERKRREHIKSDPKLYEEAKKKERERYHARKEAGKIKSIHEITSVREQRAKRKSWKASSKKYRAAKKNEQLVMLSMNSPPSSPVLPIVLNELTELQDNLSCPRSQSSSSEISTNIYSSGKSRKESGRKKVKRGRSAAYRRIKKLEEELKAYKAKYNKYKSRYYREKGKKNERKDDTPNTKVKKLIKGVKISFPIKRRLVFNEAMISQMTDNFQKTPNKKECPCKMKKMDQCMAANISSHNYDKEVLTVSPDQPGCSTNFKQNKSSSKRLKVNNVYSDTDDEWNEEIP